MLEGRAGVPRGVPVGAPAVPSSAGGPDVGVPDHVVEAQGSGVGDGPRGDAVAECLLGGADGGEHDVDGVAGVVVASGDVAAGAAAGAVSADVVDVEVGGGQV